MQKISALWNKKFAAENCDAPSISGPTLLSLIFFDSENFLQTQNGSSTKCFGSVNWTISMENLENSPLSYTYDFSISRLFQAEKSSSTKYISTVKQKIWTDNRDNSPLPYPYHFSLSKISWNTEEFINEDFLLRWDKKFPGENRDIPLLRVKSLDTQVFLKNWRAPPKFLSTLRQNIFDGKSWNMLHFLILKFFRYPKLAIS